MDFNSIIESIANLPNWVVYLVIFAFPFVQEDAAVFGAATLSVLGKVSPVAAILAIFLGLFFSDIWKYWIGWIALRNEKGQTLSKRDKVLSLKDKVETYPFTALMTARFIPLTRIPFYIACGFFKVPYSKFCLYIAFTALLYIAVVFGLFHALGAVMEEKLKYILPVAGITFAIIAVIFHKFTQKP